MGLICVAVRIGFDPSRSLALSLYDTKTVCYMGGRMV